MSWSLAGLKFTPGPVHACGGGARGAGRRARERAGGGGGGHTWGGGAAARAPGGDGTSGRGRGRRPPPVEDTDSTIALWQAPGVFTPVYRFCRVAGLTPAGTQPSASVELRLM